MRQIAFIIIVVFLASCGNQKMRYYRVRSKVKTEIPSEKKSVIDERTIDNPKIETPENSKKEESILTEEEGLVEEVSEEKDPIIYSRFPQDSVHVLAGDSGKEKVEQALLAEKNAKRALGWFIGSFFGFFALILPGIVFVILGARRYYQAKNSRYITDKGKNILPYAKALYVIDMVLASAFVIASIALIINSF